MGQRTMLIRSLLTGSTAIVLPLALMASPASAQDSAPAEAAATTSPSDGEIVVTARKRSETLISVPVTVTALSSEQIERYNTDDLSRIGEFAPGVNVGVARTAGGASISVRGINSSPAQVGFEQAVSVSTDGVQTSDGRIAVIGFFDIQQIEVMKGPQALFFGKNSPAGVIAITTAGPTRDLEARLKQSYEVVGRETTTEGSISGPLGEDLGFRVALRYRFLDGWVKNNAVPLPNPFYNPATMPASLAQTAGTSHKRLGSEEYQGRVTLRYEPAPNFSATLKVMGTRLNDDGNGVSVQSICDRPRNTVYGVADPSGDCIADNHTSHGDIPPIIAQAMPGGNQSGRSFGRTDAWIASLNLNATFGDATFSSVTGYNRLKFHNMQGNDQTAYSEIVAVAADDVTEFSQEIRMLTDFDSPINFMIGGYYQQVDNHVFNSVKVSTANYNPANGRFDVFARDADLEGNAVSVFGQLIFNINDELELTGGARWGYEKKRYRAFNSYGVGGFNTLNTIFPGSDERGVLKGRYKDENVSPEVTLSWRPDTDRTVYLSYKTGYKSGGFAMNSPATVAIRIADVDFAAERAKGFELGAKGLFLDRKLRLSAAAFLFDFKDLQVTQYDPNALAFTISNAGKVKQRGFELEASYQLTPELSVHGAVVYAHNRFKGFTGSCYLYDFPTGTTRATAVPPPNCSFLLPTGLTLQQNFDGRAPARSPDLTGTGGFVAEVPLGNLRLTITGDASYSDGYYASETMSPLSYQDSFWRLNSSIALGNLSDSWELSLIGRNLTNKYVMVQATDRSGGANAPGRFGIQRANVARGREVTLQATLRF